MYVCVRVFVCVHVASLPCNVTERRFVLDHVLHHKYNEDLMALLLDRVHSAANDINFNAFTSDSNGNAAHTNTSSSKQGRKRKLKREPC